MRTYYRILLITFILSLVSGLIFIVSYGSAIISLMGSIEHFPAEMETSTQALPEEVLRIFFNPALIISGLLGALASITNMVIGIILIASNKALKEGERVLWILGFILLNTVTNIVFIALRKSHNLVPSTPASDQNITPQI